MSLPKIVSNTIDNLKKKAKHTVKINKRVKNKIVLEDFLLTGSKTFISDDGLFYGGLFGFPKTSLFLIEILMDKFDDIDIFQNPQLGVKAIDSERGQKIQKARFRDDYLKPIKKIMKNRDLADKALAKNLIRHKVIGDLDILMNHLDEIQRYDIVEVMRFELHSDTQLESF